MKLSNHCKKQRYFTIIATILGLVMTTPALSQHVSWVETTEGQPMQERRTKLKKSAPHTPIVSLTGKEHGTTFRTWGTTFNEKNWAALQILTDEEREQILSNMFSPNGHLKLTGGRIGMNANDYALEWFSCDEVDGDFRLHYFNIDRDKKYIIPYIHAAQRHQPELTFWTSPWSPPSWMKINHHYAVQSSRYNDLDPMKDRLLFEDGDRSENEQVNPDKNLFPRRMAVNDYFIQDKRYLQTYANYFCRFIDEYAKENIPISMVMYQNEAYSYTAYPGCPWTPEGAIRFNMEYLAPTLKARHPEVSLYMGTFNTNRYDNVKQILSDSRMADNIKGVGFQWEGVQILDRIRSEYPQWDYICSECECGWGTFDWNGAAHTFELINEYLGKGCSQFYNWNAILCDNGESAWGWKQNALIRVDSKTRTYTYTPEYYAFMHYSHYIPNGSEIIAYKQGGAQKLPILVARTPEGRIVVVAGNQSDNMQNMTIRIAGKYLSANLSARSFNTFTIK